MEAISQALRKSQENQAAHQNNATAEVKNYMSQSNDCPECKGTKLVLIKDLEGNERARKCKSCLIKSQLDRLTSAIPQRFKHCTFDDYIPKNDSQKRALEYLTTDPYENYYIVGPYGSGKTHLLYAKFKFLSNTNLDHSLSVVRSTKDLINELQMHELEKNQSEILNALKNGKELNLFWDDADKFKVTEYKLEILYDLIDRIYRDEQSLTLTTNNDLRELQEKLSPAIVRRIDDICTKIEL
jgi:DNA replication protein DnaC